MDRSFFTRVVSSFITPATIFLVSSVWLSAAPLREIYAFPSGAVDPNPNGLALGNDGAFYGTTSAGGNGYGAVYRVTTSGILTPLVSFADTNGDTPQAALVLGADAAFYGTTYFGGSNSLGGVFRVTTNGVLTSLASFDFDNGAFPQAPPAFGTDGALYGTTVGGGDLGSGAFYRIAPTGAVLLASFGFPNGSSPYGCVARGSDGAFYGTTSVDGDSGNGTVFRVTTNGTLTLLYSFAGGSGGAFPYGGLVLGNDGAFYGTTSRAGGSSTNGTIFRVTSNGQLTTLLVFGGTNGATPVGCLLRGSDGAFYGTTENGGANGKGTVFRITSAGVFTLLASFNGTNGANPYATLAWGRDGQLYGATPRGGLNGNGNHFKVDLGCRVLPLERVGVNWRVSIVGLPGTTYRVLRSSGAGWTFLGTISAANDGTGQFVDNTTPPAYALYAVVSQ